MASLGLDDFLILSVYSFIREGNLQRLFCCICFTLKYLTEVCLWYSVCAAKIQGELSSINNSHDSLMKESLAQVSNLGIQLFTVDF